MHFKSLTFDQHPLIGNLIDNSTSRFRDAASVLLRAAVVTALLNSAAYSAERGFDPFGTGGALDRRAQGLTDPLDAVCASSSGPLTFPAAIDLALCRNPTTRAAWARARQQAAALGETESAWLPHLAGDADRSRYTGQHADITGDIVPYDQYTTDAALKLSWTLYDFGGRTGRIRSARKLLDAAAANANSVTQQTILSVVQAYYGVLAADAALEAAVTTEDVMTRSVEISGALRRGGAGTLGDELQAKTAYNQAVIARIQADAAAKDARGTLAVTLGLAADYPFTLDAQAVPEHTPALAARVSDLMAEAVRQRPDLAVAQAQRDAAKANLTVARATGRPVISIGAAHKYVEATGQLNQNYNQIGVSVTVPIFAGFETTYRVRQARAALEESEQNVEQARLNVTLGVWNAYHALESTDQQLSQTATLLATAQENEEVAFGRYQTGVGTIVDVLTAQNAASNARRTRINTELNWRVARAQLALALGQLTSAEPLRDTP